MYALITDGSISKFINHPKAMIIGDTQYPAKIFQLWSTSELNAIGIYEVVFDDSNKKDEQWYINTNQSFAFADNTVTASYGTATAKAHADTTWSQDDEDAGLLPSDKSVNDIKTRGLKYNLITNEHYFCSLFIPISRTKYIVFDDLFEESDLPTKKRTPKEVIQPICNLNSHNLQEIYILKQNVF